MQNIFDSLFYPCYISYVGDEMILISQNTGLREISMMANSVWKWAKVSWQIRAWVGCASACPCHLHSRLKTRKDGHYVHKNTWKIKYRNQRVRNGMLGHWRAVL